LGVSTPPHSDALAGDTGHLVVDGRAKVLWWLDCWGSLWTPARCNRALIYFVENWRADVCSNLCSMRRHRKERTRQLWRIRCPRRSDSWSYDGKGLLGLSIGWRTTMQKILYFLGGRARKGGSAIYTRRRDCTCRACLQGVSGGVLGRGGASCWGGRRLLPCGGVTRCHDDENFIMAVGAKWLGRYFCG